MCKAVGKLQQRPLPDDVREKGIKNILHDKEKGFVFLNMINPSGKQENYTVCVRGKSDQQNLHQCITTSPLKKNEVDQTVEIVSNEHCLGKGESSVQLGTPGLVTICVVLSFLTLGAVAAATFCLWKRRHKSQNKEKEVIDEDENPVYGLYQVRCKGVRSF